MTIPLERTAAVLNTEQFLLDLTRPDKTPRVPKTVRKHARRLLRHYPTAYDLDTIALHWPESLVQCPFERSEK